MRHGFLAMIGCLWLAACETQDDDLRTWIDAAKQRHRAAPPTVPPAVMPRVFRYEAGARSDPFSPAMLSAADDAGSGTGLQPDLRRTREPLESYPLASVRLIGSLRRGRDAVALVEIEQRVYPLHIGSHVGQDFGKVVAIGERTIDIDELIPGSLGQWVQRRTQLALQESR